MYKLLLNKVNLFFEFFFWIGVHDDKYQYGDYGQQWKIDWLSQKHVWTNFEWYLIIEICGTKIYLLK